LDDLSLTVEKSEALQGFSSLLSWSHYRTLSKVEHKNERLFYEIEAEKEGCVPVLERQIHATKRNGDALRKLSEAWSTRIGNWQGFSCCSNPDSPD